MRIYIILLLCPFSAIAVYPISGPMQYYREQFGPSSTPVPPVKSVLSFQTCLDSANKFRSGHVLIQNKGLSNQKEGDFDAYLHEAIENL
ncbi:MAG: hypothetical protein ISR65_05230 [Bacteriovoracaceae bacterium]|nr:hypothetical protein [Bacteriovoracaceae bacterium]